MSRHARFTHALCALPRFALVALVACGGGAPPPIAGPAAEGALEVSVSGTVHGSVNGAIVGVRTLKSGDEVVLSVRATRDAFVSVAYCDGRGGLAPVCIVNRRHRDLAARLRQLHDRYGLGHHGLRPLRCLDNARKRPFN